MPKTILLKQTDIIIPLNPPTKPPNKEKDKNEQISHQFLRQDKHRAERDRRGTPEPAPREKLMRSHVSNNTVTRAQNKPTPRRQTVPLTIWVKPIEKEDLQRIASAEKVSLSQAGRTLLRKAMQTRIDMQYSSFLEPMLERAISKHLRQRDTRMISLLVRIAFDSRQTRSIVTNILGLQPDISPELLRDILSESDKRAKANIGRKTPQIQTLMETLEKLFFEQEQKEPKD
jgi:hypothetical protein